MKWLGNKVEERTKQVDSKKKTTVKKVKKM